MRNVWKGLIVGAVTGAAVGVLLDLPARARAGGAAAAELARERGPWAAETIASAAAAGADRVRQADLPRKVREVREAAQHADLPRKVREAAQTVAASDTAQALRQASASAADTVSVTAKSAAGTVAEKARKTRARS